MNITGTAGYINLATHARNLAAGHRDTPTRTRKNSGRVIHESEALETAGNKQGTTNTNNYAKNMFLAMRPGTNFSITA